MGWYEYRFVNVWTMEEVVMMADTMGSLVAKGEKRGERALFRR
jgi:uncharacterized protein YhfF